MGRLFYFGELNVSPNDNLLASLPKRQTQQQHCVVASIGAHWRPGPVNVSPFRATHTTHPESYPCLTLPIPYGIAGHFKHAVTLWSPSLGPGPPRDQPVQVFSTSPANHRSRSMRRTPTECLLCRAAAAFVGSGGYGGYGVLRSRHPDLVFECLLGSFSGHNAV
ncbi:hypothetical protein CONLIGDRAFT_521606 [Coniochaeta ligniaria NRRL 30616]|uniref:Uncharacterized protein n=1 Tax=Coniochaeta ligniaria NRRL 30616 TaxID=1408157 RepID=A0A1J7JEZ1_9PEZI|nr:hypothetical protein CONLIGDRAFT_521606 [Coniochaeta ligniaria NRRL 30616]